MCRQSRNNKYKKCYLKKPQLYTIPEETGEGVIMIRVTSPSRGQYSPKGIKRLMNNSFKGNKSPRCNKAAEKARAVNGTPRFAKNGPQNSKKLHSVPADGMDIGEHSPRCRRVSKNNPNNTNPAITHEDLVINLSDQVCSASPRTVKRLLSENANLGNQSPPCRRVLKEQDLNIQKTIAQSQSNSPKIIKKIHAVNSDVGNHSPPCRRGSRGEDMCVGSIVWSGSGSVGKCEHKDKKNSKEKSLFKKVMKFLTVPKEDFLAT